MHDILTFYEILVLPRLAILPLVCLCRLLLSAVQGEDSICERRRLNVGPSVLVSRHSKKRCQEP